MNSIDLFSNEQIMATYKVEEGQYFKAIKDLAYGKYCYKVAQYDVNKTLIAETDYIKFSLSAPPFMIDRPW
ncbi:MAG TPA: hypothetical protein PLM63_04115 [bacterium]|nr:hypothetical protein [bacterium]